MLIKLPEQLSERLLIVDDCVFRCKYELFYCSSSPCLSSSGIDPGTAVFREIHCIHDNPAHTDQQMYSCGSLVPSMRRGGCMDSRYHKPGEPWEKSEGV